MGNNKRNKNRMQIDGKYFYKIKMLGKGAYGKVFKVKDENNSMYAVKKIAYNEREGVYADIIKEMDFLRRFTNHPNIIQLCGYKWDNHVFTVLMEFGGMPLHKFIDEYKYEYRLKMLPKVLWQLFSTLEYIHQQNMCHRDIKPDNILIEEYPLYDKQPDDQNINNDFSNFDVHVKLCDFGLSKSLMLKRNTPKTSTLWYRAPENLAQLKEYTTKIDIWAMGCVIYEYCTDEVLFEGNTTKDTLIKVLKTLEPISDDDYKSLHLSKSKIPKTWRKYRMSPIKDKQLQKLMMKCLTINPKNRPSAIELLQDEYFTSKGYTITELQNKLLPNKLIKDEYDSTQNIPTLLKNNYNSQIRKDVLDWLFNVSNLEGTELKAHTVFLGIEIFDRVMQKWDKTIDQPNQLKYISVACLDIASKFLEIYSVDLELVYEHNNKQHYTKILSEYEYDPSSFDRRPQVPKITREDMKEFVVKVNKYEQKILFLLDFVVLTSNPFIRNKDFIRSKLEVYSREIQ